MQTSFAFKSFVASIIFAVFMVIFVGPASSADRGGFYTPDSPPDAQWSTPAPGGDPYTDDHSRDTTRPLRQGEGYRIERHAQPDRCVQKDSMGQTRTKEVQPYERCR